MVNMSVFEDYTEAEKREFSEVVNTLLMQNYVVERLYNTKKGRSEYNPHYRFIDNHKDFIEYYLSMLDWELIDERLNGFYSIQNDKFNNITKLNELTTLFLLIIRLIYDEKQGKASLSMDVEIRLSEILSKCEVLKVFGKKKVPSKNEIEIALKVLRRYQLLEKKHGKYTDIDAILIIYPSIKRAVSSDNVNAILKRFASVNLTNSLKEMSDEDDSDTVVEESLIEEDEEGEVSEND